MAKTILQKTGCQKRCKNVLAKFIAKFCKRLIAKLKFSNYLLLLIMTDNSYFKNAGVF